MTKSGSIKQRSPGDQNVKIVCSETGKGSRSEMRSASTLCRDKPLPSRHEETGSVADVVLELQGGRIAHVVLPVSSSFAGMENRLYAIPWNALVLQFVDGIPVARLKAAILPEQQMAALEPCSPATRSGEGPKDTGNGVRRSSGPDARSTAPLDTSKVLTSDGQEVGKISVVMLSVRRGRIAYAAMVSRLFPYMGRTLHAIPWSALRWDPEEMCFRLKVPPLEVTTPP
jgi:sporulation protein YlmC with PRC-barrel domain